MQKVLLPKNVPMSSARIGADLQLSRSINDKGLRAFILTNMVQKSDGRYLLIYLVVVVFAKCFFIIVMHGV